MKCKSCDTPIKQFFSLGQMPLVNSFLKKSELSKEKKYFLAIGFCPHCYLVQLMKNIDPKILYEKYLYLSSTSSSFLAHCEETALFIKNRFHLSKDSLVFEIASNDGTQLKFFQKKQIQVLGIDPAENIAALANKANIPTIPKFFDLALANKLKKDKNLSADIIFGANVLAHVPEINNFLQGAKTILKSDGTAIFESPYIKGLFENKFDTIYHEHVFYFSAIALCNVFKKADLMVYDMDFTPMQGGSFRLYAAHPGIYKQTANLTSILKKEKRSGYTKFSSYQKIASNVTLLKIKLLTLLKKIKKEGKSVAVYGAPAKGVVLLNYFGIDKTYIDFIVDKAPQKQGLYVPGVHMQVKLPHEILKRNPDYILILCWNIADEVMKQLKTYKKNGGKFIIPIPKLKII